MLTTQKQRPVDFQPFTHSKQSSIIFSPTIKNKNSIKQNFARNAPAKVIPKVYLQSRFFAR